MAEAYIVMRRAGADATWGWPVGVYMDRRRAERRAAFLDEQAKEHWNSIWMAERMGYEAIREVFLGGVDDPAAFKVDRMDGETQGWMLVAFQQFDPEAPIEDLAVYSYAQVPQHWVEVAPLKTAGTGWVDMRKAWGADEVNELVDKVVEATRGGERWGVARAEARGEHAEARRALASLRLTAKQIVEATLGVLRRAD